MKRKVDFVEKTKHHCAACADATFSVEHPDKSKIHCYSVFCPYEVCAYKDYFKKGK